MKKLVLFLTVLSLMLSCSKDDDSPTYSQDKLNGTWEDIVKDEDGCANRLIITATSMKESTVCTNSTATVTYEDYKFDGKKITVKFLTITATYTINELTDAKLVLTMSAAGQSEKTEYKKIQ